MKARPYRAYLIDEFKAVLAGLDLKMADVHQNTDLSDRAYWRGGPGGMDMIKSMGM